MIQYGLIHSMEKVHSALFMQAHLVLSRSQEAWAHIEQGRFINVLFFSFIGEWVVGYNFLLILLPVQNDKRSFFILTIIYNCS